MFRILILLTISPILIGQADVSPEKGWYIGASLGGSEFSPPDSEPQNEAINDHDSGFLGLHGGYRFNKYFSLESSLIALGEWTTTVDDTQVEMSSVGHRMVAVGRLPIYNRFAILGKGGFYHHRFSEKPRNTNAELEKETTEVNFNFAAEFGVEFKISEHFWINAGIHVFALDNPEFVKTEENGETTIKVENEEGSQAAFSLGLTYRF